jgi:hypothetical protein
MKDDEPGRDIGRARRLFLSVRFSAAPKVLDLSHRSIDEGTLSASTFGAALNHAAFRAH